MNFSCIPDVGFFDSAHFLSLALHTNTIISTPVHLFGLYCILLKTTPQMKSAMWYLVSLHTWVVLFDYSFSILTIPFLLIPYFAGHPLGILRYFGVSTLVQIVSVLVVMASE
uniref:Serpentine receptor class gamma n=1 Tax=Caenorhabditis tropicalis TaxID=1561998 RepID=A0A1I7TXY5_9PELO